MPTVHVLRVFVTLIMSLLFFCNLITLTRNIKSIERVNSYVHSTNNNCLVFLLTHLTRSDKVSFCDRSLSVVRPSYIDNSTPKLLVGF